MTPIRSITQLDTQLAECHQMLLDIMNWADQYGETGQNGDTIRDLLEAHGVDTSATVL